MTDYYLIKPSIARLVVPQTIVLLILELFAFIGVLVNLSLLDIEVDSMLIIFILLFTLIIIVIFPDYLKYKAYGKVLFYFYADRLMYNSFTIPYDKILNVFMAKESKSASVFFNGLFNTGTLVVEMFDDSIGQKRTVSLENLENPKEMTNYIIQLVARYKNYKGTGL